MPQTSRALIGVLGGTFDPVHHGHLRLAECARAQLGLSEVLWIPAGQPPHRTQPRTPSAQRLEMVRLAIASNPAFAVDDAEVRSADLSYTVNTLERLRRLRGAEHALVLLLGVDAFAGLTTWMRWRELFELAHIAVANRPGYPLHACELPALLAAEYAVRHRDSAAALRAEPAGAIVAFEITPLAISATDIRTDIARAASVRYLLPDSVLDYIERNQLYSAPLDGR